MSNRRLVQFVGLLACGALLAAAALRMPRINAGRVKLNIMGSESPLENTPPEYVFYIQVFGAFRGLIADIAFIRAESLKQAGRFYDAMQLHEWICALQPHFPAVWEYAAWNMSWNISVTTFTPQERWNWVYNGVKLLRDRGIQFNPRAINLYKQLAWTFNNKMGDTTDEFHYAYKCQWAWRMHLLLGPPPDPLAGADRENLVREISSLQSLGLLEEAGRKTFEQNQERLRRLAEARGLPAELPQLPTATTRPGPPELSEARIAQWAEVQRLREIQQAPDTLAELYQREPATRRLVAALRPLGIEINDEPLSEDTYWVERGLAFAFFQPYRALAEREGTRAQVMRRRTTAYAQQARMQSLDEILGISAGDPAGRALVRFLQKKVLREVYKLDPTLMIELVENFGAMDWRTVDSQALYWVARGLIAGGETVNRFGHDKTNTARILFFCLRNLFLRGHVVFEPNPEAIHQSYLNLTRDLNFIAAMNRAYLEYGPLFDPDTGGTGGAGGTYRGGHVNFLTEAIRLLYLAGREDEAAYYYQVLRETYPLTVAGQPNPAFDKSLRDFVLDSFRESLLAPSSRDILIVIEGFLLRAFEELAAGNLTSYTRYTQVAREYHDSYMREKRADPLTKRVWLKEFDQLQIDSFAAWLLRPSPAEAATLHKVHLWRNAPVILRQAVYDDLLPLLKSECEFFEFDVAKAFPEPPAMDEYRRQHPRRAEPEPEPEVRTLPRAQQ